MKNTEYAMYDHLFPREEDSLALEKGTEGYLCKDFGFNFIGENIVWGNGKQDAKIMVIGMDSAGASNEEERWRGSRNTKIPLTNKKTGAKLRILLDKAGINPFSVF